MFFDDRGDDFGIFLAEPAEQCYRAQESVTTSEGLFGDCIPGTPILAIRENCVGDVSYSVVVKNLGVRSCAA